MFSIKNISIAIFSTLLIMPNSFAQSINSVTNFDFGLVEVAPGNGVSRAKLSTNGVIKYTGNFSGAGNGIPASFVVTGIFGATIEIGCQKNIKIANSTGAQVITINRMGVNVGTSNATNFANRIKCTGIKKVIATHVITGVSSQDTILAAGRINATGGVNFFETYTNNNPNGTIFKVRILYQ